MNITPGTQNDDELEISLIEDGTVHVDVCQSHDNAFPHRYIQEVARIRCRLIAGPTARKRLSNAVAATAPQNGDDLVVAMMLVVNRRRSLYESDRPERVEEFAAWARIRSAGRDKLRVEIAEAET